MRLTFRKAASAAVPPSAVDLSRATTALVESLRVQAAALAFTGEPGDPTVRVERMPSGWFVGTCSCGYRSPECAFAGYAQMCARCHQEDAHAAAC